MTEKLTKGEQELAGHIWYAIETLAKTHTISKMTVTRETKTIDAFPTKTKMDEEANRFGSLIHNLFFYFNTVLQLDLKLDYPARTEFDLFETFGDLLVYFFGRITGVDKVIDEL